MWKYQKALTLFEQSLAIENKQLTKILPSLTEEQKVNFLKLNASSYEKYDALVLDYPQNKSASKKYSIKSLTNFEIIELLKIKLSQNTSDFDFESLQKKWQMDLIL